MNLTKSPRLAVAPTGTTANFTGQQTGADVNVVPANPLRIGLLFANCSGNRMYVNFGAAASAGAGSIVVPAFTTQSFGVDALPSEDVHTFGTAGDRYTIKEIA